MIKYMENNKLTVNVEGGNRIVINVYDILERPDINKKYIIYDIDESENDNIYISILEEDETSFTLKTIEDQNELKEVEDYLIEVNSEDGDE